jgi:mono/diheme cytochrome c family protein
MTEPAPFALRTGSRLALFAAPFVVIGGLWAAPGLMVYDAVKPAPPAEVAKAAPDGHKLFLQHCANCHGPTGEGNGPAQISPAARHFGYQPFKFATTPKQEALGYSFAAPADDDLLAVLKRGIPGSSMPAFQKPADGSPATQVVADLTDDELKAIVGHVRTLTRKGVYARLLTSATLKELKEITGESDDEKAAAAAEPKDWADARKAANKPDKLAAATEQLTTAGPPLAVPARLPTPNLANGKQLFVKATCASCHGAGGKGDGEQFAEPGPGKPDKRPRNSDGTPAYPRDLTAGIYKGGGDTKNLYARVRLGIPGTPMPATEAKNVNDQEMADLIAFVQSLREPKPQ